MQAHRGAATLSMFLVLALACTPTHPDALGELGDSTDTASSTDTTTTGPADATSSDTGDPCTSESSPTDTGGAPAACCRCGMPVDCWEWSDGPEKCEEIGLATSTNTVWCELDVFGSASGCWAQCAEPAETGETGEARAGQCCECSTMTCEPWAGTAAECEAWSGGAQLYVWCDPSSPVADCWAQCG